MWRSAAKGANEDSGQWADTSEGACGRQAEEDRLEKKEDRLKRKEDRLKKKDDRLKRKDDRLKKKDWTRTG